MWHFSAKFWHCLWKFVTCSVSRDIVFKSTLMLHSSITSYHFQQILVSQSAIICHEISSTARFSTSQTSKMHCSTTTDRRIISQPRYMVVSRYQKQNTPLLKHQNRIETTVSTHTRKRQHKRLRIASVLSNTRVGKYRPAGQMWPATAFSVARRSIQENLQIWHFLKFS